MKISYDWLNEYVDVKKSPEELGTDLTLFGHELETIEKAGKDSVLDFEITPNRGDCLSILGIAREASALYEIPIKLKNTQLKEQNNGKELKISIEDSKLCQRYSARIIDKIKILPSPEWLVKKIKAYGFRSINNVVDVTNLIMIETGQPLHAFDYDKISHSVMKVRRSKKNEEVMTLDGINRVLPEGALIAEDDEKIFDLAGIMGGFKSEVDSHTKTIVLQAAIFDPVNIRTTSKYLNHVTDASYRYERGVDYDGTIYGLDLAAKTLQEITPDIVVGKLIDIENLKPQPVEIEVDIDKINRLLGTDIQKEQAFQYLDRLGFKKDSDKVDVPSYRLFDVKIWQDIAEEVGRVFGYNNIPLNNFQLESKTASNYFSKRESIKDYLSSRGFTEIYSYSFIDPEQIGNDKTNLVKIANPLSPETEFMRPSLEASLLASISKNPWAPEVKIYEIEKVFEKENEKWQLGIASTGNNKSLEDIKSELKVNEEIIKVEKSVLDKLKIRKPVNLLLVDIENLDWTKSNYDVSKTQITYKHVSKFPPTIRDLSFIFSNDVKAEEIIKTVKDQSQNIIIAELFDEYRLDDSKKSLAFHFWLQEEKGPMEEINVNDIMNNIINRIESDFSAKLRSKE